MTHIEAISHTIIPITGGYLIVFYMVFDVGCNGFAELTRFADRQFYTDWWNSNSWDEFARNWNKPVHEFLLRHVYLESINTYKMSKTNATLVTFLFSSIVHEFFMAFTLRLFVPWLFFFQMSQVPLIYIFRHPFFKNSRFGNHFFWFGLLLGVPLLTILYGREYCLRQLTKV
jgi:sterol O-acyltransferase